MLFTLGAACSDSGSSTNPVGTGGTGASGTGAVPLAGASGGAAGTSAAGSSAGRGAAAGSGAAGTAGRAGGSGTGVAGSIADDDAGVTAGTGAAGAAGAAGGAGGSAAGAGGAGGAAGSGGAPAATFTEVYAIFTSTCAGATCHIMATRLGDMLSFADKATAYMSLVGVNSVTCAGEKRVVASDPTKSELVAVLAHTKAGNCANTPKMPDNKPMLPPADIDKVRSWVMAGALNN